MKNSKDKNPFDIRVDVVIPVLNEAHVLGKSIAIVRDFLRKNLAYYWRIVIVDNGSTDGTLEVAQTLANKLEDVEFVHFEERGRGRALREAWQNSTADVVLYTDVDLSTELTALPKLVIALVHEDYDIAIGSRLARGSKTTRCFKREITSKLYNLFIKCILFTRFTDAQCGFKAVTREIVEKIVPQVKDQNWFFDTELLVIAEKQGFRIKDIPVTWIEDDDSRVRILNDSWRMLKGVLRLRWLLLRNHFLKLKISANRRSLEDTISKPISNTPGK